MRFGSWAVFACLCLGCGGPDVAKVAGTVTLDGTAVPEGEILFVPTDPGVPPQQVMIVGGNFSGEITPGPKKVKITAWRDSGKVDPVMGNAAKVQYLPARYNDATELTADIKAGQKEPMPFELKSGK